MFEFKRVESTFNLPEVWDELADNYFQQTKFLAFTEKFNPCRQRYYLCFKSDKLVSAAIVYSLRLNILTFSKIRSYVKTNIAGIPCSVSSQGIFGEKNAIETLKNHISKVEHGLLLFLNLVHEPANNHYASGKTLPTIVLTNHFNNWDDYFSSLRSNYRRRLRQIIRKNKDLRFEKFPCSGFTREMYIQYLDVYKRSIGKLEKLSFDFFKNLPAEFILTVCFRNNSIIGWNIALEHRKIYYFFLGGIDYKQNKIYNTYLGLLTILIQNGIDSKAACIELGQTAEIPKMRTGGKPEIRYMEAHHSSVIINGLLRLFSPLLEYRQRLENTSALKEDAV